VPPRHTVMQVGVMVALALLTSGCATQAQPPARAIEEPVSSPARVPALTSATLNNALEELGPAAARAIVVFPAVSATYTVEATSVAGTWRPSHLATVRVQERTRLLSDVAQNSSAEWSHRIAVQDPLAGVALSTDATITLSAGPHPHEAGLPWLATHDDYLQASGSGAAELCLGCHDATACAVCHIDTE